MFWLELSFMNSKGTTAVCILYVFNLSQICSVEKKVPIIYLYFCVMPFILILYDFIHLNISLNLSYAATYGELLFTDFFLFGPG